MSECTRMWVYVCACLLRTECLCWELCVHVRVCAGRSMCPHQAQEVMLKRSGAPPGWRVEGVRPCSPAGLLGGGEHQECLLLFGSTLTCSASVLTNKTAPCPVFPAHPQFRGGLPGPWSRKVWKISWLLCVLSDTSAHGGGLMAD